MSPRVVLKKRMREYWPLTVSCFEQIHDNYQKIVCKTNRRSFMRLSMHLSNTSIVMIKFEMMTSSWIINSKLLCWELDTNHHHKILVTDSLLSLICKNFQCISRKSLVRFTDAAFLSIKMSREHVIGKPLIRQQLFFRYLLTITCPWF